MDQNDLFTFFMTLRRQYSEDEIPRILEMYEITKLDVNRIYRYLDKYIEKSVNSTKTPLSDNCDETIDYAFE